MSYLEILLSLKIFFSIFLIGLVILIIKSDSQKRKKILKIFLAVIFIWITFFTVDYIRVKKQKLPIFCSKLFGLFSYMDGGTIEYIGFGYKVIDFHQIVFGTEGWENIYKLEEKYICPWNISKEEAFKKIEQQR